jgi:hypothetical protein
VWFIKLQPSGRTLLGTARTFFCDLIFEGINVTIAVMFLQKFGIASLALLTVTNAASCESMSLAEKSLLTLSQLVVLLFKMKLTRFIGPCMQPKCILHLST